MESEHEDAVEVPDWEYAALYAAQRERQEDEDRGALVLNGIAGFMLVQAARQHRASLARRLLQDLTRDGFITYVMHGVLRVEPETALTERQRERIAELRDELTDWADGEVAEIGERPDTKLLPDLRQRGQGETLEREGERGQGTEGNPRDLPESSRGQEGRSR